MARRKSLTELGTVHFWMPKELIVAVDAAARDRGHINRSDFLRELCRAAIVQPAAVSAAAR